MSRVRRCRRVPTTKNTLQMVMIVIESLMIRKKTILRRLKRFRRIATVTNLTKKAKRVKSRYFQVTPSPIK